jgi:membrane protein DedA with SNARE-associated domain
MSLTALLGVFAIAAIPLLPTEPMLIAAGALAAAQHTSPMDTILVATAGCVVSDHLLYGFGRVAGSRVLSRVGSRRSIAAILTRMTGMLHRWGAVTLIAGRWVPGGGTAADVLAGSLGWRLRAFTPASLVGSSVWSIYATLLGFLGGSVTGQPVLRIALPLGVALVLGYLSRRLFVWRRSARGAGPDDSVYDDADDRVDCCESEAS